MKRLLWLVVLFSIWTVPVWAWNCKNPLATRIDVGTTKPSGTAGDGDGQYFLGTDAEGIKGHYYVCEVPKPKTPSKPKANPITNTNSNANQNANNNINSNTNNNTSSSVSSATGGSATQSQQQGQKQGQSQSASSNQSQSAAANNNSSGNTTSYQSTTNYDAAKIPVNTAYAPTTVPTMSCFKTYSGGVQFSQLGLTGGGGKVDENCRKLETAVHAPNQLVFCKVYITTKDAKAAGVTLQDCLGSPVTEQVKPVAPIQATPATFVQPEPAPQAKFHTESVDHTQDGGECTLYRGRVGNVCARTVDALKLKLEANQDANIVIRAANTQEAQIVTKYLTANDIPASRIADPTITGKNPGFVDFSIHWTSTVSVAD